MNLDQAISLHAIGGPGSGPHAPCPQCGPKGGRAERYPGPKGGGVPKQVSMPSPRIAKGRVPTLHRELLKDAEKRLGKKRIVDTQEMRDWFRRHPSKGEHTVSTIREGDRVKLQAPAIARWVSELDHKIIPAGRRGVVIAKLPAVFGNPELLRVKITHRSGTVLTPAKDVSLTRLAGKPLDPGRREMRPQPVPENRIKMQTTISDGAKLTIIRPSREVGSTGRVSDYNKLEHPDKGSFENTDKEFGMQGVVGHEGQNLKSWVFESDRGDGSGSVVWLHKYTDPETSKTKQTIIREENFQSSRQRYGKPIQFEYNNPAKAFKTLRDRYGISMTMKDWRY